MFDPYSDDPRLAVKKIALCPKSGTLAVAGTAGSILLAQFSDESDDKELEVNLKQYIIYYNFINN